MKILALTVSVAWVWLAFVAMAFAQDDVAAEGEDNAEAVDPQKAYVAAGATVDADLASALQELAAVRKEIAAEKPAVAKAIRELASELREKQRRVEIARQDRDELEHELQTMDRRVALWRDEAAYIESLLADFEKQHQARAGVASFQESLGASASDPLSNAKKTLEELRITQEQGGRSFSGQVLDADGVANDGEFVEIGPLTWFVADDDKLAGLVIDGRDLRPEVVPGTAAAADVRSLVSGEEVELAFDPTLGSALAMNEAEGGLLKHIQQGGLWIWPILLLALIATIAAIVKWLQIARIRDVSPVVVRSVIDAVNRDDQENARVALAGIRHPSVSLLRRGIEAAGQSREQVEEVLYEEYIAAQPALQRGLPFIAIASATAPLLGLLGTVTGMIGTFERINIFGTNDTNVIAGGISEALVTTEVGLIVAIPALIVHALLSRRVQGIRSAMEMTSLAFLNGLGKPAEESEGKNSKKQQRQEEGKK